MFPDLSPIAQALFDAGQTSVHISGGAQGGLLVAVTLHDDGAYQSGVMSDWTAVTQFINEAANRFVVDFTNDVADESPSTAELAAVIADRFQIRRLSTAVNLALFGLAMQAKRVPA